MQTTGRRYGSAAFVALAFILCVTGYALASVLEERQAYVSSAGFTRAATASVSVDTTAGGTTITAGLATRARIEVFVELGSGEPVYLSTGTPTTTDYFVALTSGQQWVGQLGSGVTLKGITASGTVVVKVVELGAPL
jgi:hypothetical protein